MVMNAKDGLLGLELTIPKEHMTKGNVCDDKDSTNEIKVYKE